MIESIAETRLPNGLTILTDKMPDVRSVTLGIYTRVGARHEPLELNGISHFIEHAVFKGTTTRTAREIAIEIDRLGGGLDAFTTHEEIGFAMKVVDNDLEKAFDLLSDLVSNPRFDERDLRSEKKVIIEEIKMTEDAPEELLSELFHEKLFPANALGRPIAGTPARVRSFNAAKVREYHSNAFAPENLVIAAAGNLDHAQIVSLTERGFKTGAISTSKSAIQSPDIAAPYFIKKKKDLEQVHLIIASPLVSARSEKRYAADILTSIIGGGTSSRLWQKVREERGLAYSVGTSAAMYNDCGVFTIYAATSPANAQTVVDISLKELAEIVKNGVTRDELDLIKAQSKAAILLGLEDSATRAATLARMEMTHGRQISLEESLQNVENVTVEELQQLAKEIFQPERLSLGAIGDINKLRFDRNQISI